MANFDDVSMDLILMIQLRDIFDLQKEHVHAATEDFISYMKLAAELYREELREASNIFAHHRFGEMLGDGIIAEDLPPLLSLVVTPLFHEAYSENIYEAIDPFEMESEDDAPQLDVPMKKCAVCGDEEAETNMMTAPCSDTYWGGCVNGLFERAQKQELNFPPKCCGQTIAIEDAELLLSSETYHKFQRKFEEFSTTNRTYCFDLECATFLPSKAVEDNKAKCPACEKLTCTACESAAHEGDCREDPAVESFLTTAAEAGFRQCRECKRMIELVSGCYHITFLCGAEFCYMCGAQWKRFDCELWDEENLMAPAEDYWLLVVNYAWQLAIQFDHLNAGNEEAFEPAAEGEAEPENPGPVDDMD